MEILHLEVIGCIPLLPGQSGIPKLLQLMQLPYNKHTIIKVAIRLQRNGQKCDKIQHPVSKSNYVIIDTLSYVAYLLV